MVSDIKGPGHPATHTIKGSAATTQSAPLSPTTGPAGESNDVVSLTDLATRLQRLSAAVSDLPVVDQQRVDKFRSAITNGEYQIDEKAVAEKLAELESLLSPPTN